jgi:hypothetical protein
MIDTDKYEGHSEGEWVAVNGSVVIPANEVSEEQVMINTRCAINAQLIADAPLLLAEVKRLRDKLFEAEIHIDPLIDDYTFENDIRELHYIEEVKE